MTDELKCCPFCGSPAELYLKRLVWRVKCSERDGDGKCLCHATSHGYREPESAIAAWNTRHESDELPEWFVNKLNESIIDCGLLEAELKDDNDIEEAVRVGRRANTLRWVLTLRKPEEK